MYEIQIALRYAPEFWSNIPNYKGYYQVSNLGRVKSLDRQIKRKGSNKLFIQPGQILKPWSDGQTGRLKIGLSKKGKRKVTSISRLVALAFLGKSKKTVDHINGNYLDNHIVNLRYMTLEDNARLGNAVLTEAQVKEIKQLLNTTMLSQKAIGKKYGVARETVKDIKFSNRWKHIA